MSQSSIETTHALYAKQLPRIRRVRDCIEGDDLIKAKGELYLPYPADLEKLRSDSQKDHSRLATKHYQTYKSRAVMPDITTQALQSAIGIVSTQDPMITLPPQLDYLRDNASGFRNSLKSLYIQAVREVLTSGGYSVLVDVDSKGMPRLFGYVFEDCINWTTPDDVLTMCVLRESVEDYTDRYSPVTDSQYRIVTIDGDGEYRQELYRKSELVSDITPTDYKGIAFEEIPIFRIGSSSNGWSHAGANEIPLMPVARLAIKSYQVSADAYNNLYLISQAMLITSGIAESQHKPSSFSSSTAAHLPTGGNAQLLQVSPSAFPYLKMQMDDLATEGRGYGASLLASAKVEAADAIRAKSASQQATLRSVAGNVADAFNSALKSCAAFIGVSPDSVGFAINQEFDAGAVDTAILAIMGDHVLNGLIPADALLEKYKELGVTIGTKGSAQPPATKPTDIPAA